MEPRTQTYDASYESLISNYFSDFQNHNKPVVHKNLKSIRRTPQFIRKKPRQTIQNTQKNPNVRNGQNRELSLSKITKVIKMDDLQKQLSARTARADSQTQHFVFEQPRDSDSINLKDNKQATFKSLYAADQATIFNDQFQSQNASLLEPDLDMSAYQHAAGANSLGDSNASISQYTQK